MSPNPQLSTTVGKTAHLSFPDGSTTQWEVVDEIRKHEDADKILLLQRLRSKAASEPYMLRFCYYIIGKKPKMKSRWTWGQYAPFISTDDFSAIIAEAQKKKWI